MKKVCNRCGCEVVVERKLDYPYYCPNCHENMFGFEVHEEWREQCKNRKS